MKTLFLARRICSLRNIRIIRKLAFQAACETANIANIAPSCLSHFFYGVISFQHHNRLVGLQQNSRASLPVVSTLSRDHCRGWRGRAALRSLQSINTHNKEVSYAS